VTARSLLAVPANAAVVQATIANPQEAFNVMSQKILRHDEAIQYVMVTMIVSV
jgi:hypothetical protein